MIVQNPAARKLPIGAVCLQIAKVGDFGRNLSQPAPVGTISSIQTLLRKGREKRVVNIRLREV
jgi:hypothetical protein